MNDEIKKVVSSKLIDYLKNVDKLSIENAINETDDEDDVRYTLLDRTFVKFLIEEILSKEKIEQLHLTAQEMIDVVTNEIDSREEM